MLIYSDLLRTTCKKYQFNYPISLEGKGYGQGFKLCKSGLVWFDGEKGNEKTLLLTAMLEIHIDLFKAWSGNALTTSRSKVKTNFLFCLYPSKFIFVSPSEQRQIFTTNQTLWIWKLRLQFNKWIKQLKIHSAVIDQLLLLHWRN